MPDMSLRAILFGEDKSMGKTFKGAGNEAQKAGDHIGAMGRIAGGLGKAGVAGLLGFGGAMVAAGGFAAKMGISTAAANEQAQISFTTMLGSGKKAQAFLKELQAFAAATPFEFPELQTAASSLISAGINANKVIPIMRTLGDVTSGMGTGSEGVKRATIAIQQMTAAGKIQGQDLNQLRDAGIPVYDLLSKATGKTKGEIVKLANAGKLGQKELSQMMKALESGKGLERFSGLMDKQSQSLTGLWSTFHDTLNIGLANAIKPVIPLLKDGLGKASEYLAKILPKVSAGLAALVKWLVGSHPNLARFADGAKKVGSFILHDVVPAVGKFVGWLKNDLWPALQKGYQTILPGLKQALSIIAGAFKGSGKDGQSFGDIVKKVGNWVTTVLVPALAFVIKYVLPLLAVGIRNNIEAIKIFWRVFQTLMSIVGHVFSFIIGKVGDLMGLWATMLRALSHVPGFGWAKDAANKMQGAANAAHNIANAINGIPSKKNVTVTVTQVAQGVANRYASGAAYGTGSSKSGTGKKAAMNAKGTRYFPGGLSWVGEAGPELLEIPRGAAIHSNADSVAMARSGSGGDQKVTVQLVLDGKVIHQSLLKIKRQGGANLGLA